MEAQPLMLKDTPLLQEYQSVDDSADLSGEYSGLAIHALFLASKNTHVNHRASKVTMP
jgi:hypothetical protein